MVLKSCRKRHKKRVHQMLLLLLTLLESLLVQPHLLVKFVTAAAGACQPCCTTTTSSSNVSAFRHCQHHIAAAGLIILIYAAPREPMIPPRASFPSTAYCDHRPVLRASQLEHSRMSSFLPIYSCTDYKSQLLISGTCPHGIP